jgi:RHH-type proline utilization regulon transcriptional repressor/proline dehydrogenase/delta 1-pyrroline-5-carboxylate dehydrogenase
MLAHGLLRGRKALTFFSMDPAPESPGLPQLPDASEILFERDIQRLGRALHQRLEGRTPGVFEAAYWQGLVLERTMRDPALKTDLFRLVDALPALSSSEQIARHAREYLLADHRELPAGLALALRATQNSFAASISAFVIKRQVRGMAERFIVGRDARHAQSKLKKLWERGFGFTVDLLGEATVNASESTAYAHRYADLIDILPGETARWKPNAILDQSPGGSIPRANISLKLSAMDHLLDPADVQGGVERLLERVRPLLLRAKELGAFINFDLEQWNLHEITYRLFERVALDPEFKAWPHLGIVVQAYLKDAGQDVERLLALCRQRGTPLTVRLVKGAYWDYEVVQSGLQGHPCPVFTEKGHTDASYERLAQRLLDHHAEIHVAFGTHNLRSISATLAYADQLGLKAGAYEFQMLYGMAEPERDLLRALGHRVRLYAPVGDLITGMAYLVRRLLENTANSSFLRLSHHDHAEVGELMAKPVDVPATAAGLSPSIPDWTHDLHAPFRNCPLSDFTANETRAAFARAVLEAEKQMPWQVPVVIEGHARTDGTAFFHITPNDKARIATSANAATVNDAAQAIAIANKAWPAWRDLPVATRAARVNELGARLESDRLRLAAMEVHEQAKPWREADADIAEAVDFCRYYARQALIELSPRRQGNLPGEINTLTYEGRGLCGVIAPWNFPLAILCGMATAALVAGNAVLLKPAEQATAIAFAFHQHALAAGIPPGVLAFLPGDGAIVGEALVRHRDVVQIAFTGSREVGLSILRLTAEIVPGQTRIKRVVCEMGGKNAIIVDDDADLDEAVTGVIASAFGYAGQKCSACSRLIVVGGIHENFIHRLRLAAEALVPASAARPDCLLPPVIDEASHDRLHAVLRDPGPETRRLHLGRPGPDSPGGWFVPPAIFEVADPLHPLMQRELFGPILTVFAARDFSHALEAANTSDFALTGAVYSRSPRHLEQARQEFRVGNLYLNRPCTGALVHRQPFGGFKMSGAGTKAGGPGYLLHFAEMRVCTENTMRRGFAPEIL